MSEQVWILVIDTRYGTEPHVFRKEEDARDLLHEYAKEHWDPDDEENSIPEDRDEAIETYFSLYTQDWYVLEPAYIK
jgi:hypothetical protein